MPFTPGTKLGPYEVLAPIDSGVAEPGDRYKASDSRANRIVSLKVLPEELSTPETKARLARDARTISSLNHPNIAAVMDVGHHEPSTDFVVAEFIDGETLAARLTRGRLPVHEAIGIAIAIADSLDKAHRAGVVHGALSTLTVMLTPAGPKLLDFGVARVTDDSRALDAGSGSMTATRTSSFPPLSATPTVAMPYIAPECLTGAAADPRSDIFAAGALVYEMVTGRPAFHEKTVGLLIAAIQTVDPEPAAKLEPTVPPALDHVIQRCLAKDPRQRLQTAWDLLTQLRWIAEGGSQIGIPAPQIASRKTSDRVLWGAAAVLIVAAAGVAPVAWGRFQPSPPPPAVRFLAMGLPTPANPTPLGLSPDGRWIVTSPGQIAGVIGMPFNSAAPQIYVADNVVTQPFWSPDSRMLAFFETGQLKKAAISGGPAQNICDVTIPIGGGSWGAGGDILFSSAGLIHRVSAAGGQAKAITTLDKSQQESDHLAPVFLPDGRHYIFHAVGAHSAIYLGTLDSPERTRLFDADTRAAYAAPGYILFSRGPTIFAQPFDPTALKLTGEAIRVADSVLVPAVGPGVNGRLSGAAFAVSQTGTLVFRTGPGAAAATAAGSEEQNSLFVFDRNGNRGAAIGPPGGYAGVDLSPDGTRAALHRHEGGANGDNWVLDIAQNRLQRLTFNAAQDNSSPVWSPDGRQIAFVSNRNNRSGIYVKPADGTGAEELIVESDQAKSPTSWSPDGKVIVFQQTGQALDIWGVALADKKPFPLVSTSATEQFGQVSPDGKWLAYQSNETGRAEVYVKSFPDGPGRWQVSTDGGIWPRWRGDSKELFFSLAPNILSSSITVTGASLQAGVPQPVFAITNPNLAASHPPYLRYAVSADGKRFVMPQQGSAAGSAAGSVSEQIIAAADNTVRPSGSAVGVTVVLNWTEMLTKK